MAQMSSETKAFLKELVSELRSTPKAEDLAHKKARAADDKRRKEIRAATFKTKRFAHYVVGGQGAYAQGRSYNEGDIIRLPIDALPSLTFRPVDQEGVALIEFEAAQKKRALEESAGAAADDDALDPDELAADAAAANAEDDAELEEDLEAAPTPPAAPKKKGKAEPKRGTAGKGKAKRASDQDVA